MKKCTLCHDGFRDLNHKAPEVKDDLSADPTPNEIEAAIRGKTSGAESFLTECVPKCQHDYLENGLDASTNDPTVVLKELCLRCTPVVTTNPVSTGPVDLLDVNLEPETVVLNPGVHCTECAEGSYLLPGTINYE